jgi:hypothetical protein
MASGDTPQVICVLSLVARNSSSATRRPSILMVGEDIHDAPGHAGKDRHADTDTRPRYQPHNEIGMKKKTKKRKRYPAGYTPQLRTNRLAKLTTISFN